MVTPPEKLPRWRILLVLGGEALHILIFPFLLRIALLSLGFVVAGMIVIDLRLGTWLIAGYYFNEGHNTLILLVIGVIGIAAAGGFITYSIRETWLEVRETSKQFATVAANYISGSQNEG